MENLELKLSNGVDLPKYATLGSAGLDVSPNHIMKIYDGIKELEGEKLEVIKERFNTTGSIHLRAFERVLFGTGLTVSNMPSDMQLEVRSRSGVTLKRGLVILNSPGTIDPDYRGEIGIIIYNSTPFLNRVDKGERIAQLVAMPMIQLNTVEVQEIIETERGSGGFGSTGNK